MFIFLHFFKAYTGFLLCEFPVLKSKPFRFPISWFDPQVFMTFMFSACNFFDFRWSTNMDERSLMPPPSKYIGSSECFISSPAHAWHKHKEECTLNSPQIVNDSRKHLDKAYLINQNNLPYQVNKYPPPRLVQRQPSEGIFSHLDANTKHRLRQRLMFLHHASTCPSETCYLGFKCLNWKRLASHVACCRNGDSCNYKYCVSSRAALSHYMTCSNKDRCSLCGPVRRQIKQITKTQYKVNEIIRPNA